MPADFAEFAAHVSQLDASASLELSEADTRVFLIDPVLRILGYTSMGDVRREVAIPATKEFIDYLLYAGGRPVALLEAKAARHQLGDQAAAQCVQYAAILGVRWCVISNGRQWAFYDAHAKGPLRSKRVALVDLAPGPAADDAWSVISLFGRDVIGKDGPLSVLLVARVVEDELQNVESPAVRALVDAVFERFGERVAPGTVVRQVALRRSTHSPAEDSSATTGERIAPPPVPNAPAAPLSRAGIPALVAAGLLPEGAMLEGRSRAGSRPVARIETGKLRFNDIAYESPSSAASAARGGGAVNGWEFWTYQGSSLASLRARLADGTSAPDLQG